MDKLTGMRVYTHLALSGSIAATARALGMSHTMATKHLNALEARLGTRLLHRATRSLRFTDAGQRYLEAARNWLSEIDHIEVNLREEAADLRGHIRITAPVALGQSHVAPVVADFLIRNPMTSVEMSLSDQFSDMVEEGYDLAIRVAQQPGAPNLIARKLGMSCVVYCASPAYLSREGAPASEVELSRHNCIGHLGLDRIGRYRWRDPGSPHTDGARSGSFHSTNPAASVAAAAAGLGIIREPDFVVAAAIASGALVEIPFHGPAEPLPIWLVMPSRKLVPTRVRRCADFIAETWREIDAEMQKVRAGSIAS